MMLVGSVVLKLWLLEIWVFQPHVAVKLQCKLTELSLVAKKPWFLKLLILGLSPSLRIEISAEGTKLVLAALALILAEWRKILMAALVKNLVTWQKFHHMWPLIKNFVAMRTPPFSYSISVLKMKSNSLASIKKAQSLPPSQYSAASL